MEVVDKLFAEATSDLPSEREEAVDNTAAALHFLKKLTPHAVGAARSLASELHCLLLNELAVYFLLLSVIQNCVIRLIPCI